MRITNTDIKLTIDYETQVEFLRAYEASYEVISDRLFVVEFTKKDYKLLQVFCGNPSDLMVYLQSINTTAKVKISTTKGQYDEICKQIEDRINQER